jgi:hypothetical protein
MKVPCARVGARLPGIEIKQARVRGIESFGMLCPRTGSFRGSRRLASACGRCTGRRGHPPPL